MATKQKRAVWAGGPPPVTSLMAGAVKLSVLGKGILYLSTMIQIPGSGLYGSTPFRWLCYRNVKRSQSILSGSLTRIHLGPS